MDLSSEEVLRAACGGKGEGSGGSGMPIGGPHPSVEAKSTIENERRGMDAVAALVMPVTGAVTHPVSV
ncbi:MAG TPA: hypothetical protein VF395_22000 [Polyangiaceae bacterium]